MKTPSFPLISSSIQTLAYLNISVKPARFHRARGFIARQITYEDMRAFGKEKALCSMPYS
jgi:hypothetical protein